MPWRLISFLLSLIIITVFIAFNLDNVSDISFGFTVLTEVPIFVSLLVAFLAGALVMLPAAIGRRGSSHGSDEPSSKKKALPKRSQEGTVGDDKQAADTGNPGKGSGKPASDGQDTGKSDRSGEKKGKKRRKLF
jgi:uncharacterized integral membrane protein